MLPVAALLSPLWALCTPLSAPCTRTRRQAVCEATGGRYRAARGAMVRLAQCAALPSLNYPSPRLPDIPTIPFSLSSPLRARRVSLHMPPAQLRHITCIGARLLGAPHCGDVLTLCRLLLPAAAASEGAGASESTGMDWTVSDSSGATTAPSAGPAGIMGAVPGSQRAGSLGLAGEADASRARIAEFLQRHTAYELIPESSKVCLSQSR